MRRLRQEVVAHALAGASDQVGQDCCLPSYFGEFISGIAKTHLRTDQGLSSDDSDLVQRTLSGDREAFGLILARYQALISSLAYSATGNLGQSEDLTQETFITAWTRLGHLRERDQLRPWLCGIARNRINNALRRDNREPIRHAEPLDAIQESAIGLPCCEPP